MATVLPGKGKSAEIARTEGEAAPDAIQLLETDHRDIAAWFSDFAKADSPTRKAKLSEKICLTLKVHMKIEEEIFYPASRAALKSNEERRVDEAVVEHASSRTLIGEIERMEVGDDLYDSKIKMLGDLIAHHVGEEEGAYFLACRKTDMDMKALGAKLAARKGELMKKLGGQMVM